MISRKKFVALLIGGSCCLAGVIGHCDEVLFDGKVGKIKNTSLIANPDDTENIVAAWTNAERKSNIALAPENIDWSKYNTLSFRMYSANAENSQIMVICESNIEESRGNYYFKKLTVDWTGWKTIVIPFKDFGKSRKPVGWNHITSFKLYNHGWGLKPVKGSEYYVDDIKLITVK
jgi:carbohydrate binding protein with CBM11 domain